MAVPSAATLPSLYFSGRHRSTNCDRHRCHNHRPQAQQQQCTDSKGATSATIDLRQQSPHREPSYREVMQAVSSDLSLLSSSVTCTAHPVRFHSDHESRISNVSTVSLVSASMHSSTATTIPSTTRMRRYDSKHRRSSACATLCPSCLTSTQECQCLLGQERQTVNTLSPPSLSLSTVLYCSPSRCSPSSCVSSPSQTTIRSDALKESTANRLPTNDSDYQSGVKRKRPHYSTMADNGPSHCRWHWSPNKAHTHHTLITLLVMTLALLSSHLPSCDTQPLHHRYPRITPEEFPGKSIPSPISSWEQLSQLNNRRIRQPQINPNHFCGLPPLVPNSKSNLHRNQKHHVFPVGQDATYMCDQGYKAVDGTFATHCLFANNNGQPSSSPVASRVVFPYSDHQLGWPYSGRSKNSKRLVADIDEEPEVNANSHYGDKRKLSRKTDDDLNGSIAYEATHIDGRHSDLENDSVGDLEKRKQRMEITPRWWPPITLNCQIVNCTDPGQVDNAKRTDKTNGQFNFNSNVQYQCDEGYETIGIPILTCRANGEWNRQPPKCRLKQCPQLPPLNDGRILYSNERRTDSQAEYHCNEGLRLNALTSVRHCRPDNQWSVLDPVNFGSTSSNLTDPYQCVPVECLPPTRPHAGLRIIYSKKKKKFLPGDMIIYTCETVKTKATAKCRPDGEWSREPPHCPEVNPRCPQLPQFPHGEMKVEQNRANFSCYDGYELDGSASITCSTKGVWNAAVPRCVINLPIPKVSSTTTNQSNSTAVPSNLLENDDQITSSSNQLTVLWIVIAIVLAVLCSIGGFLLYKNRSDQRQRQRWRNYFGHYHHRQSKTNIVVSSTYNNLNGGANAMSTGLSSLNNSIGLNAASRHLLQQRQHHKNTTNVPHNFLQSSFSSSDDNPVESGRGKSFHTGTISSEHARTVSTYAEDTCPEDEFDEEEEDEDLYNTLQMKMKASCPSEPVDCSVAPPIAATRRSVPNGRPPSELTVPESTPMMLLTPTTITTTANGHRFTASDHIYSNVPRPSTIPSLPPPTNPNRSSNVPVTEL